MLRTCENVAGAAVLAVIFVFCLQGVSAYSASPEPAYGTYGYKTGYYYNTYSGYGGYVQIPSNPSNKPLPIVTPTFDPTSSSPAPSPKLAHSTSACPACPVCSDPTTTSSSTSPSTSKSALATTTTAPTSPTGQCYCRYDFDWDTWALDDPTCKAALHSKCAADTRLPCDWVTAYYASSFGGHNASAPHSKDLTAFLYNDCPPGPPCACSGLSFEGSSDSAEAIYYCCQDLQVYAAVPYSGISETTVNTFCGGKGSGATVKAFVQHQLWHQNCSATGSVTSGVYTYNPKALSASRQSVQASAAASGESSGAGSSNGGSSKIAIAAVSAGIGGLAVGALVAGAVMAWWSRKGASSEYSRLQGSV